jgi:hypothetical protein
MSLSGKLGGNKFTRPLVVISSMCIITDEDHMKLMISKFKANHDILDLHLNILILKYGIISVSFWKGQ